MSHAKHHHRRRRHHKEKQILHISEQQNLIPVNSNQNSNYNQLQIKEMRRELTQALENIRYIAAHCAHESFIESIRDEWKFIATVIDRLEFLIFLTVTVCGSLALLFQVYYFIIPTVFLFNLIFFFL